MNLIIRIIVIGGLTYLLSPFSTWWIAMVIALVVCFVSYSSGLNAFISGFLGVGLIWMAHSWNLDVMNASSFSSKIAQIMQFEDPIFLVLASGAIGGLAGGFSSLTGSTFRQLFLKQKKRSLYN